MANAGVDFFNGLSGFLGWLGRGWYPTLSKEGVSPFLSARSDAGKIISPGNSLELAAVWACVRLISETISTLPFNLYYGDSTGRQRVLAVDHPIYGVLHDAPNAYMTPVEFWEMMAVSLLLWGNAYAVKQRIGKRVVALDPLRPEFTSIYRTDTGEIRYAFKRGDEQQDFGSDDILHIKGFGVDGLVGLSPIGMARQTIGRAIATDEAAGKVYASGLSASGFIKYTSSFKTKEDRDAVRDSIAGFTGSSNIGKVMILENGMDYTPITMNPVDAQLLESRSFNVEEVCRWFGVPPQLIGHIDKASSWASSLENTTLGFLKFALRPYLTRFEQSVKRSLLIPADRSTLIPSFQLDELLRGDSTARAALYASAGQNGWMDRNEIRSQEYREPRPGGDQLTVQSNLVPLDKLAELGGKPTTEPQKVEA